MRWLFGTLLGKSLGGTEQGPPVVTAELSINTFHRRIAMGLGTLDSVSVVLLALVVVGVILGLRHFVVNSRSQRG